MPELLAPAGNMECLTTAFRYGADAVYLGGPQLQLRADKAGFTREGVAQAVQYAHGLGKRVYVTVNAFANQQEVDSAGTYARWLQEIGADAAIISDLGVLDAFHEAAPELELHISTQANIQNARTAAMYHRLGASRVILGREMTLSEIETLRKEIPDTLEVECFVHGAMCMAFSGRCLLSASLNGRSANRGDCTQPCRWRYQLVEETRPGQPLTIEGWDKGTAILSAYDLCCVGLLPQLEKAGVASYKIEGRMKNAYYVGTVVNAYRACMDGVMTVEEAMRELGCVTHRPYSTGFYENHDRFSPINDGAYHQTCRFAGVVQSSDGESVWMEQRNKFVVGDTLEVLTPGQPVRYLPVSAIYAEDGTQQETAHLVQQILRIPSSLPLQPGDLVRLRQEADPV